MEDILEQPTNPYDACDLAWSCMQGSLTAMLSVQKGGEVRVKAYVVWSSLKRQRLDQDEICWCRCLEM